MARIFISHSHANNAEALALRDWLVARGWDDLFLDIDPHCGLVSGQRWLDRLQENAQRCKAVIFVLSRGWLTSKYCIAEFWEARKQERRLFAVVIDDTAVDEVPAEMRGVWQLAFLTRGSRFETFSVWPPPSYALMEVRFSHEGLESLRLGLAQAGLTSFDTASFPWPAQDFEHEADGTTPRRPYRGLKPVDIPEAGVFFGRDADLVRARDNLADLRDRGGRCVVVLLGASGSGKSSFLRAGLLPRLSRDDRRFVPLPVLRPREAAMWGDDGLLTGLEKAHRKAGIVVPRAALRADLEAGGAGFLRRLADLRAAAARGLPESAKPPTLVLPVDQAEELFTTVRGGRAGETGAEAGFFLLRLAEALHHGPELLALITIRSDAYEPLQTAGELAGVPQIPFNLPPLATADYRSVIEGPAERVSEAGRPLTLEPELVATLLADAQGADALPLLGFTLERLYTEHGGNSELTLEDYQALDGVQGSIEAAVSEAFATPEAAPHIPSDAAEREALLKSAFVPHLMGVNEANGEPVRRTARRANLPEAARGLIDRLIAQRLLVTDRRDEETVIEVAHEALLRRWPTLRRWHDQERAALVIQQEIARASAAWSQNASGGNDWLTHRGSRLEEAEKVARREDFAAVFKGASRAYLDACRQCEDAAREAEIQTLVRQRAMQRAIGTLLVIVAVGILVGGWLVVVGRRDLAQQRLAMIATYSKAAFENGYHDRALRLALAASQDSWLTPNSVDASILLGQAAHFSRLEAQLGRNDSWMRSAAFLPDGDRIIIFSGNRNGNLSSVWSRGRDGSWNSVSLPGYEGYGSAVAPDGNRVFASYRDKPARVWSREPNGSWSSVFLPGQQGFVSAAFSSHGDRIVTTSEDTGRVWSREPDGSWKTALLKGHQGIDHSAAFSPAGDRLFTISDDNSGRVWSLEPDGSWSSTVLQGHQEIGYSAIFSPDGDHIVVLSHPADDSRLPRTRPRADDKNSARVWSRDQNGSWSSILLQGHQAFINSVAFSPDGGRIVTASWDRTARVWSREQGGSWNSIPLQGHQGWVVSAAFSPDGQRIVTASLDNTARIWSRIHDSWNSIALQGHLNHVVSAVFSPDGNRIVTTSADDSTRVWWSQGQDGSWNSTPLEGHQAEVTSAAFSPDGHRIVTASSDKTARVWSRGLTGWSSVPLQGHQDDVSSVVFSPDGTRVITVSFDKTVRLWSQVQDGSWRSVTLKGHQDYVSSAVFSPDGHRIVTASSDKTARVWSEAQDGSWSSVPLQGHQDDVSSAVFSPDGDLIVTASRDTTARVWSRGPNGSWNSIPLKGNQNALRSAVFSPDGQRIITISSPARVWSRGLTGSWNSVPLQAIEDSVNLAVFSPDGDRIVTVSDTGNNARVWSQGQDGSWNSVPLQGHQDDVTSAAFSPDGHRIVTASLDQTARVWSQGQDGAWYSVPLVGHQDDVTSAVFSPDGHQIVTASSDKTARVWDVRWLMGPGDWVKAEPLSLPETVCREKLQGSWITARNPKTGRNVQRIAARLITVADVQAAPILAGREGEDVCAPFVSHRPWWSRFAFWH